MSVTTISAYQTTPVVLGSGNYDDSLTVTSTGTLTNGITGIGNGPFTLNDYGLVSGGNGNGSYFYGGNGGTGISFASDATVSNSGTITGGAGSYGKYFGGNGGTGIYLASAATLSSDGIVTGGGGGKGGKGGGVGGTGISLAGDASATISGTVTAGSGSYGKNSGGNGGTGITLTYSAAVSNGGRVTGGNGASSTGDGAAGGTGISLADNATVSNSGTVTGGSGGTGFGGGGGGGTGINLTGTASATNTGSVSGGSGGGNGFSTGGGGGTGINLSGDETVSNSGTVSGGSGGSGAIGGTGISLAGGALATNSGVVTGGSGGYDTGGGTGISLAGGALATNSGKLTGGSGGHGFYGAGGGAGAYLDGGTLVTSGSIVGGAGGIGYVRNGAAGDAVRFGALASTLVVEQAAVFGGLVMADASAADVLIFGSASAGYQGGIGTQFTNFSTIAFTEGATWDISGTYTAFDSGQVIDSFAYGDTIALDGFAATGFSYVSSIGLEISDAGGDTITLDLVGSFSTADFTVHDPQAVTYIEETNMACFAAGTRILTADGRMVAVENLARGDAVELFDGSAATIWWIGHRTLDLRRHSRPELAQPVLIAAGALGHGLPWRDLVVSPDHALFIDGHLIPAKTLLNGATIRQLRRERVTYYHIELPRHAVLFAEGAAAESYLEIGNRGVFENGGVALALHPDFARRLRDAKGCAPFAEAGPVVEATRRRLLEFAAIATTDDPDLLIRYEAGAAIIESRSFTPGDVFADPRDRRRLGVKISAMAVGVEDISLDRSLLTKGWHDLEPNGRWTDGAAVIPATLLAGKVLTVKVAATGRYPIAPCQEASKMR